MAKAGIAGMTLTVARDLGSLGIRAVTVAPSLFDSGLTRGIPQSMADGLTRDAAFPRRMGHPEESAQSARHLRSSRPLPFAFDHVHAGLGTMNWVASRNVPRSSTCALVLPRVEAASTAPMSPTS